MIVIIGNEYPIPWIISSFSSFNLNDVIPIISPFEFDSVS